MGKIEKMKNIVCNKRVDREEKRLKKVNLKISWGRKIYGKKLIKIIVV